MKAGERRGSANSGAGVLDAGVVLARLDRNHRSHRKIVDLFDRSARGRLLLHISVVNLAEVLQHARQYSEVVGLDPVALLASFKVIVRSPGVEDARRVAELASLDDASLADRFATATADILQARLHTTDAILAGALKKWKAPVTLY